MYTERPVITLEASVDMKPDRCISLDPKEPGKVIYTPAGTLPYGRTNRPQLKGRGIAVVPLRTAIMEEFVSGAVFNEGDKLEVGEEGKVIKQDKGIAFAIARQAANKADKEITVILIVPEAAVVTKGK